MAKMQRWSCIENWQLIDSRYDADDLHRRIRNLIGVTDAISASPPTNLLEIVHSVIMVYRELMCDKYEGETWIR